MSAPRVPGVLEGRTRGGSEVVASSGSPLAGRLGAFRGGGVGVGDTQLQAAPPLRAPPFTESGRAALKSLPRLAPRPPRSRAAPRRAEPPSPGRACFVAKRSLQRLIGPRRWGDRSPLICELRRAQRLVHKSAPGAALAAPEPGAPRSCSCRTLASPRAPGPRQPRTEKHRLSPRKKSPKLRSPNMDPASDSRALAVKPRVSNGPGSTPRPKAGALRGASPRAYSEPKARV